MQTLRQHIELAIPKGLTSDQLREDFISRTEEQVQEHLRALNAAKVEPAPVWIIRGVKGELYPCKPDIFAATYELAEQGTQTTEGKP